MEIKVANTSNQEKLSNKVQLFVSFYSYRNRKLSAIIVVLLLILTWCCFLREYQEVVNYSLLQCSGSQCHPYFNHVKGRIDINSIQFNDSEAQLVTSALPFESTNSFNPSSSAFRNIGRQYIVKFNRKLAPKACQQPAFVVLAINSAAKHFKRRIGIRQTWANAWEFRQRIRIPNLWKVIFIVGRTGNSDIDQRIDREAKIFGDLVIIDLIERHHILTEKTILGMYWARRYCQARYYYKGDDDVWINKWRLLDYLMTLTLMPTIDPRQCWIGFLSLANLVPVRDKRSKYYVSYEDYPLDKFAPFCSGFSYFMTAQTVDRLIWAIPRVKKIPGLDDVYIGLLANVSQIEPQHNDGFHAVVRNARNQNYTSDELYHTIAEHGVKDHKLMISFHRSARTKYIQLINDVIID